ncbi:MAG: cupin domain-containing protein [Myxococcales bacterium]|nr:cupin domain-containing protein [Myxococcales bacterium]
MADDAYDIRTDIKYGQGKLIDVPAEIASHQPWFNQSLTTVNDAVVRLGLFHGEFHFHKHDEEDELFFVLEGRLELDIRGDDGDETVVLERHQGYTVPHGVVHRTRSQEPCAVLMIEKAGVVPRGD